jgi:GNAT superfamily N-acetyltransferase
MPYEGPVHFRRATTADAAGIASVHLDGWRRAHEGLVPEAYFACKSSLGNEEFWRGELELEAADRNDDLDSGTGEVYTLFVTPECWEKGIRSHLIEHVARDLREHRFMRAVFWVLAADEVMRAFAQFMGWRPDGATRHETCGETQVEELRYSRHLL